MEYREISFMRMLVCGNGISRWDGMEEEEEEKWTRSRGGGGGEGLEE